MIWLEKMLISLRYKVLSTAEEAFVAHVYRNVDEIQCNFPDKNGRMNVSDIFCILKLVINDFLFQISYTSTIRNNSIRSIIKIIKN